MNRSEDEDDDPPSLRSFGEAGENEDDAAAGLRHGRGPRKGRFMLLCVPLTSWMRANFRADSHKTTSCSLRRARGRRSRARLIPRSRRVSENALCRRLFGKATRAPKERAN